MEGNLTAILRRTVMTWQESSKSFRRSQLQNGSKAADFSSLVTWLVEIGWLLSFSG
jgi:hypothetical protein